MIVINKTMKPVTLKKIRRRFINLYVGGKKGGNRKELKDSDILQDTSRI